MINLFSTNQNHRKADGHTSSISLGDTAVNVESEDRVPRRFELSLELLGECFKNGDLTLRNCQTSFG
jgi:hypothetical protein